MEIISVIYEGILRLSHRAWNILNLTVKKFSQIDGTQWAGAFAFNAFFSLFPLVILMVTIASAFIEKQQAIQQIITYIENYIPLNEKMQSSIFNTIANVINMRNEAGIIALLILAWSAIQGIATLIYPVNYAWDIRNCSWWRMPLKSFMLLIVTALTVLLSKGVSILMRIGKRWLFKLLHLPSWIYTVMSHLIPFLMLFIGLCLFYILAPCRPIKLSQVWIAALFTTALIQVAENLFIIYLENFSNFNALYGTFGGIMALLLWIYLSGVIFIIGACLGAAQNNIRSISMEKNENKNKENNQWSPDKKKYCKTGNFSFYRKFPILKDMLVINRMK